MVLWDGGKPRFIAEMEILSVHVGLTKEINFTFLKQFLGFSTVSL